MNGLALLALIVLPIVAVAAYRLGASRTRAPSAVDPPQSSVAPANMLAAPPAPMAPPAVPAVQRDAVRDELSRLVRSYEADAASARATLSDERARSSATLADAHAETARYRRIVVDIENNAPPPLFDAPGTPDDLKLIVGIGPVLERMLHQLGVGTYRQIANWTDRDIDAIDAKLPEFPGRIRRDGWVTQARELHLSKYGERP